jgi:hypothetical protein
MVKISSTDHVKNEEVLHRKKEERNNNNKNKVRYLHRTYLACELISKHVIE